MEDDQGVHGGTRRALHRWIRLLNIETPADRFDARIRLISPEDQELLRQVITRQLREPVTA